LILRTFLTARACILYSCNFFVGVTMVTTGYVTDVFVALTCG